MTILLVIAAVAIVGLLVYALQGLEGYEYRKHFED
jgi:hypothetical protein